MIGSDRVRRGSQWLPPIDRHGVGADAVDGRAHRDEKAGEILHVWFRRDVAKHGGALRAHRRHQGVFGARDTGLIEKDVGATQLALERIRVADRNAGPEALKREKMRIDAPPSDDVAARRRQRHATEPRQHRPGEQNRRTNLLAERRIERPRFGCARVHLDRVRTMPLNRRANVLQQLEQRLDVANAGNVVDATGTVGEQGRRENRKGRVLVAGGADRPHQRTSSRDTERRWHRSAQATRPLAPASSVRERCPSCILCSRWRWS